jgi:hypothetical protein
MASKSPITNNEIKTSAYSEEGRKNHDRIFAKKSAIEWAKEEGIVGIYGAFGELCGVTVDTPISYGEFKRRMELKDCDKACLKS